MQVQEVAPMSSEDFQFFANFLRERSGISIDSSKAYLVEARMATLLKEDALGTLSSLVAALRQGGHRTLEDRVIDEMMTNETSFFRDIQPFRALQDYVIPALLERRENDRKLQIWSAACATGQEPYSIAILIKEHFPELADWTLSIVATDLSDSALQKAREGSYSQLEVNRGLPSDLLTKYFVQSGMRWQIKDEIRDMVEFRKMNLLDPINGLPPADIVFVRNVLIYFELDVKRESLARIREVMNPSSYLFLGGSETTLNIDDHLKRLDDAPRSGCYQLGKV